MIFSLFFFHSLLLNFILLFNVILLFYFIFLLQFHEALRIVVPKVEKESESDGQFFDSTPGDSKILPNEKIGPHNDVEILEGFAENPDGTISITISPKYIKTINLAASNGILIPKNCVKRFEKSGIWLVCDKCPVRKPVHRLEIFAKHYAGHGSNARMRCK